MKLYRFSTFVRWLQKNVGNRKIRFYTGGLHCLTCPLAVFAGRSVGSQFDVFSDSKYDKYHRSLTVLFDTELPKTPRGALQVLRRAALLPKEK